MPLGHITTGCPAAAAVAAWSVSHSNSTALVIVPASSISDQPQKVRPFAFRKLTRLVVNQRWYFCLEVLPPPVLMPKAVIWLASYEYEFHWLSPVATTSSPRQCM